MDIPPPFTHKSTFIESITEYISMECFHTKTKVIMTANQKLAKYEMEPLRTQSKTGKLSEMWKTQMTNFH